MTGTDEDNTIIVVRQQTYLHSSLAVVQSLRVAATSSRPRRLRHRCASSLASHHYRWSGCGCRVRTKTQHRCRDPRKPKPRQQPNSLIPGHPYKQRPFMMRGTCRSTVSHARRDTVTARSPIARGVWHQRGNHTVGYDYTSHDRAATPAQQ